MKEVGINELWPRDKNKTCDKVLGLRTANQLMEKVSLQCL